jgi:hypothetical protein
MTFVPYFDSQLPGPLAIASGSAARSWPGFGAEGGVGVKMLPIFPELCRALKLEGQDIVLLSESGPVSAVSDGTSMRILVWQSFVHPSRTPTIADFDRFGSRVAIERTGRVLVNFCNDDGLVKLWSAAEPGRNIVKGCLITTLRPGRYGVLTSLRWVGDLGEAVLVEISPKVFSPEI